ncbi:TonB-dependent receptor domain-containing protein, partial [Acinetobacter baumannii]|uniref:TonB-dependent receptor domain-containing protein n=1 Tax=Acinetobacter baumannii TaxID=470 RepID=UPI0035DC1CE8
MGFADTMSFAGDRVQLTAGLRRQEVRTDSFNVTSGALASRYDAGSNSPAAALLVRLDRHLSVYANYIEGLSKGQS